MGWMQFYWSSVSLRGAEIFFEVLFTELGKINELLGKYKKEWKNLPYVKFFIFSLRSFKSPPPQGEKLLKYTPLDD